MIPGRILHRLAFRFCSDRSRALVIESVIADLQHEWSQAHSARRGLVLARGYAAFWFAFVLCGLRGLRAVDMEPDDRRAVGRALAWAILLVIVAACALTVPPLIQVPGHFPAGYKGFYLVRLIPQALPLAIPVGLTLGIILGLARRPVSRASAKVILMTAALCSIASLATIGWIMPAANQSFRVALSRNLGDSGDPKRGNNELTLGELRREVAIAGNLGEALRVRQLSADFHIRWAIPCATLLLAAFALSLLNRSRSAGRLKLVFIACGVFAGWLLLLALGQSAIRSGVPPFAGIWLPNLLLTFCFLLLTFYFHEGPASVIEPSD